MDILLVMRYAQKNLSIILIILLTLLLIAIVIWVFDKKIESIENMKRRIVLTGAFIGYADFEEIFVILFLLRKN